MSDVNLETEPPDASFYHAPSRRKFTVYRRDGRLHHREAACDENGQEFAVADHPVRYLIGSGNHTRSYLVEVDGFLVESPITWYASRQSWAMSPGYDRPNHRGFERAADATCLVCHVGQLSAPDEDYQRFTFLEKAIGCERCHGPGSLHTAEEKAIRNGASRSDGPSAPSIVNPRRLTRDLTEAICAQCHLMSDAAVTVRGRGVTDFRPGLPLADFTANYRLDEPDARIAQMKVVGHVEQLRQSRCYQASEKLTCTTCHDPHATAQQPAEHARNIRTCLNCHGEERCRLERSVRLTRSANNDCLSCHMPRAETEIPHIAFTHHRIGIHDAQKITAPSQLSAERPVLELKAIDDESQWTDRDRQRNLGLAYLGVSLHEADPKRAAYYRKRASGLLEDLHARGLVDGETFGGLARIAYANSDGSSALSFAGEALNYNDLAPKTRVNSLFYFGQIGVTSNNLPIAGKALEQLVAMRWLSEDWFLLGVLRQREGNLPEATRDLEHAVGIAPFRPELRRHLAEVYERQHKLVNAQRQLGIARQLDNDSKAEKPLP